MRRAYNLNWARTFEASARLLSFTRAARELELTQAGVSQHIRMLEQELGEPLFLRLPRALRLTDAGEAYLRVVQDSFDRLQIGTADLFGPEDEGVVRLRADPAFIDLWLVPRLPGFVRLHPRIAMDFSTAVAGGDTSWGAVDMEVRYENERMEIGLDAVALMGDTMFPVCDARLAGQLLKPGDLMQHRLLHVAGARPGWAEWLAAMGVTEATPSVPGLHSEWSSTAISLAEEGLGIALCHAALVAPRLRQERLVRPFPAELETDGIFYVVTPSHHPLRRQPRLFRDWLLAEGTGAAAERPERLSNF